MKPKGRTIVHATPLSRTACSPARCQAGIGSVAAGSPARPEDSFTIWATPAAAAAFDRLAS